MAFDKYILIMAAFDKRDEDPNKNYGIHGCDLIFTLKGEQGGISWRIFTNWQLPHVRDEEMKRSRSADDIRRLFCPSSAEIRYHSKYPRWDDQETSTEECEFCGGGPCYSDISFLQGDTILPLLISGGSQAVWAELERIYKEYFRSDE